MRSFFRGTKIGEEEVSRGTQRETCLWVLSGDRNVLFRGRFRAPRERRDAEGTSPLKSQLFCQSRAHESTREIFLAMTEVYGRDFHTWALAGACAQCAPSNYISLCLSTTHLSTRTRWVPPPSPPPSLSCATFSANSADLPSPSRRERSLKRRRRLDVRQIEHDRSLNPVAIHVNFLFHRTLLGDRLELVSAEKYYRKRKIPESRSSFCHIYTKYKRYTKCLEVAVHLF